MHIGPVEILVFAAFIYSVIAHEVAHGYVALKCGDPTAKLRGRLTANPIPHIDPWMTIVVPILMATATRGQFYIGSAKPVPVNVNNLRVRPRDDIAVSLAGVSVNLLIAIACATLYQVLLAVSPRTIFGPFESGFTPLGYFLVRVAVVNVVLLVFNLVPIPPLDGSRVFRYVLKGDARRQFDAIEPYGFIVIVVLLNVPVFGDLLHGIEGVILRVLFTPIFAPR